MKAAKHKAQAHASQAGTFGTFGLPESNAFGRASSSISYLAEQPNLSTLTDPNLIVSFKNLAKRDSTTRTKAVEEIQGHVSKLREEGMELEDSVLEAWVKVYPRASIDVARRVRQTAHSIQGQITSASGKRFVKHMQLIIGPWFIGLHDADKAVARTAKDALFQVFATPEKQAGLKKVYQSAVLEFCCNVVESETPQTLSDERNTSTEDSEALYSRVISSSIAAVTDLIISLDAKELQAGMDSYAAIMNSRKLWALLSSKDKQSRRAVMRLLDASQKVLAGTLLVLVIVLNCNVLTFPKDLVTESKPAIVNCLLSKQTMRQQSGTSAEYTNILAVMTTRDPSIWVRGDKTATVDKLQNLVKYGSLNGLPAFWNNVSTIISHVPRSSLPADIEQSKKLLEAIRGGVLKKHEPRSNCEAGMACFFSVVDRLLVDLDWESQQELVISMVMPFISHYVNPTKTNEHWALPTRSSVPVITRGLQSDAIKGVVLAQWNGLVESLLNDVGGSLPEQAKEFDSSQLQVQAQGKRLFSLLAELSNTATDKRIESIEGSTREQVISKSIEVLKARNGKPYGAAGCILAALEHGDPGSVLEDAALGPRIETFVVDDLPRMISTPSQTRLISLMSLCLSSGKFTEAWQATLQASLSLKNPSEKRLTVQQILSCKAPPLNTTTPQDEALQDYVRSECRAELDGGDDMYFTTRVLAHPTPLLSQVTIENILVDLAENLLLEGRSQGILSTLAVVQGTNSQLLSTFIATPSGSVLVQNLLRLQEIVDEAAAPMAKQLTCDLDSTNATSTSRQQYAPSLSMVQSSLGQASSESVSVRTLVELAMQTAKKGDSFDSLALSPHLPTWSRALEPYLMQNLPASFIVTEDLGSISCLTNENNTRSETSRNVDIDAGGFSLPLRIAIFTSRLLPDIRDAWEKQMSAEDQYELYRLLALTARLANDKLGYEDASTLWASLEAESEDEILEFVSASSNALRSVMSKTLATIEGGDPSKWKDSLARRLWHDSRGNTNSAMHHGRVFATLMAQVVEEEPAVAKKTSGIQDFVKSIRRSEDVVQFAALAVAFRKSLEGHPAYDRMINEIVADLTSIDPESKPQQMMRGLCQLDVLSRDQEEPLAVIPHQRVVFFIRNVAKGFKIAETAENNDACKALTCRAFASTIPCIYEMYGEHWKTLSDACLGHWPTATKTITSDTAGSASIALRHAQLKLFAGLRSVSNSEDVAEDLQELLAKSQDALASGLIKLLITSGSVSDTANQPLRITNELLARQVSQYTALIGQAAGNDLYTLLNSESRAIQQTAFNLLHRQIPKAQEDVSLAAALDKKEAMLPDELLSLILQTPSPDVLDELSFERQIPSPLFAYLSSWLLVFDHWKNASDKVRTDYAAHLRESDVLPSLTTLIFSFLGHAKGRPVDASKFDATNYSFDIESSPIKDVQWLLIHLYYLCLKRIPSLTKSWWIDCKSRSIKTQVEPWTVKHFSPLVQADALGTVNTWAETQSPSAPDAITVKTHPNAGSITASKEIDDQTMSIVITLPSNFPLGQVTVTDGHRVAVDAKRWNAWKMNTQGVIAFSDNSIPDGLMAWRRNVVGQLKGQTECAICYAIVGADKSLPTKKCGTCSNAFHGGCLYRWFKSSNSSSCPLCRTAFNYA